MNSKEDQSEFRPSEPDKHGRSDHAAASAAVGKGGDRKDAQAPSPTAKGKKDKAPADLGRALKTVYDDTLREDVPKDFLDLLGKLS